MVDLKALKERFIETILGKIEGTKDLKRRLDYLMKPEILETSSILSEQQLQGVAECCWLGDAFPSMGPLKDFARQYAQWTISKDGRGRDQATQTMLAHPEQPKAIEGLGIHLHQEARPDKGKEKGNKD